MKKKFFCALVLLLVCAAAQSLGEARTAYVRNPNPSDRLHLREDPRRVAASMGRFYNGTVVSVLGESGGFCQVRIGEGKGAISGYMLSDYISSTPVEDATCTAWVYASGGESGAWLYTQPDASSQTAGRLSDGAQCRIWADTDDAWVYVFDPGTESFGFLSTDDFIRFPIPDIQLYENGFTTSIMHPENKQVHLRAGMGTHTRSLGQFYPGEDVYVLHQKGEWSFVRVQGLFGYIRSRYLAPQWTFGNSAAPYAFVAHDTAVLAKPFAGAEQIGDLLEGAQVYIVARDGNYARLCLEDDALYGYVPLTALYVTDVTQSTPRWTFDGRTSASAADVITRYVAAQGLCTVALPGGDENARLSAYATCDTRHPIGEATRLNGHETSAFSQGESFILLANLGEWSQVFDGYNVVFVPTDCLNILETSLDYRPMTPLGPGTYTADGVSLQAGLYTFTVPQGVCTTLRIYAEGFERLYTPQGPASYSFYLPQGASVAAGEGGLITAFDVSEHDSPFTGDFYSGRYIAGINGLRDTFWVVPAQGAEESYIRVTTFEQEMTGAQSERIPLEALDSSQGVPESFATSGCFVEFFGCVLGTNG